MSESEATPRGRNWGGRRPGAGAPRGNRNAVRRSPHDLADAELEALVREAPFDALLRFFPPAVRELLRLALRNATAGALQGADALPPLPDPADTRARRIELYLAAMNLVMTIAADAWNVRLQRDPREAALIRALKPWLVIENPDLPNRTSQSSQSSSNPDADPDDREQSSQSTWFAPGAAPTEACHRGA
ncbi:MAG: hypothetical protein R3C39_07210 [Dehalococcoidia bacterium]